MIATCGGCSASWGGVNVAHCSGCHQTFTTVGNFDHHRVGGRCSSPSSRGLMRNERGHWSTPVDEAQRDRLREIRAKRGKS